MPEEFKLAEAWIEVRTDLQRTRRDLNRVEDMVSRSTSRMQGQFSGLGSSITRFMAPLLTMYAIKRVVDTTAAFGRNVSLVNTMLDESTEHFLPEYRLQILDLSSAYGKAADDMSKALYQILSASIPAGKALDILEISSEAAIGGFTRTEVAADAITTILNAYSMAATEATKVSDMMFAAVKRGKTTYEELAGSIGGVISTAALLDIKLEEVFAALTTMTRAGISTSEAVNALNALLIAFLDPQQEALNLAKKMGLELTEQALKTDGLIGIMRQLEGATTKQINAVAGRIRGFKALATTMKNLKAFEQDIVGILNSQGDAAEATAKAMDNLATDLDKARQGFKNLMTELGATQVGALRNFTQGVIDLTNALKEFLRFAGDPKMEDFRAVAWEEHKAAFNAPGAPGGMMQRLQMFAVLRGRAQIAMFRGEKVPGIAEDWKFAGQAQGQAWDKRQAGILGVVPGLTYRPPSTQQELDARRRTAAERRQERAGPSVVDEWYSALQSKMAGFGRAMNRIVEKSGLTKGIDLSDELAKQEQLASETRQLKLELAGDVLGAELEGIRQKYRDERRELDEHYRKKMEKEVGLARLVLGLMQKNDEQALRQKEKLEFALAKKRARASMSMLRPIGDWLPSEPAIMRDFERPIGIRDNQLVVLNRQQLDELKKIEKKIGKPQPIVK